MAGLLTAGLAGFVEGASKGALSYDQQAKEDRLARFREAAIAKQQMALAEFNNNAAMQRDAANRDSAYNNQMELTKFKLGEEQKIREEEKGEAKSGFKDPETGADLTTQQVEERVAAGLPVVTPKQITDESKKEAAKANETKFEQEKILKGMTTGSVNKTDINKQKFKEDIWATAVKAANLDPVSVFGKEEGKAYYAADSKKKAEMIAGYVDLQYKAAYPGETTPKKSTSSTKPLSAGDIKKIVKANMDAKLGRNEKATKPEYVETFKPSAAELTAAKNSITGNSPPAETTPPAPIVAPSVGAPASTSLQELRNEYYSLSRQLENKEIDKKSFNMRSKEIKNRINAILGKTK